MNEVVKTSLDILIDNLPTTIPGASPIRVGGRIGGAVFGHILDRQKEVALDQFLEYLSNEVGNIGQLLSDPWLKTEEGARFWEKVLGAALDAQIADKRQLFANTLINGIVDKEMEELKRLKFVDLLRSLSKASLMCLAEIHAQCEVKLTESRAKVETPRVHINPLILSTSSIKHYTESLVQELHSAGLFISDQKGLRSYDDDKKADISPANNLFYTELTRDFARFIGKPESP